MAWITTYEPFFVLAVLVFALIAHGLRARSERLIEKRLEDLRVQSEASRAAQREASDSAEKLLGAQFQQWNDRWDSLIARQADMQRTQSEQLRQTDLALQAKLSLSLDGLSGKVQQFDERLKGYSVETANSLSAVRATVEARLSGIQTENSRKLDEMRDIVDRKLQSTLNERVTESFRLVSERLEQVYKAMGEMQTLAQGVGDLKKVLSNVQSRGVLGEVQLGAILTDILTKEQYALNVATKKGSANRVEFAVKLPTEDGGFIYLPIDSKFPGDTYAHLCDAYEGGDAKLVEKCVANLLAVLRSEARDISTKYIDPPHTTDFAILFLPFEGLYAEVVNRGMVEELQRAYRVNIAGPSTMAALLNSLQMSFRTIAIQRRSDEVWRVLGGVQTEFEKFEKALVETQRHMNKASEDLEALVGTRTRMMRKKLADVTHLRNEDALPLSEDDSE